MSMSDTTAPALAEPERRVRPVWTAGVVLVNVGINAAFFGPLPGSPRPAGGSLQRTGQGSHPRRS